MISLDGGPFSKGAFQEDSGAPVQWILRMYQTVVEMMGFEPTTSAVRLQRSPS